MGEGGSLGIGVVAAESVELLVQREGAQTVGDRPGHVELTVVAVTQW